MMVVIIIIIIIIIKVVPVHAMKATCGEWRCISPLDGEWSASRLGRFTPKGRDRGTHWVGAWGEQIIIIMKVKFSL